MTIKAAGLTGGIATGKTTVARLFQEYGSLTLNGDRIAEKVLAENSPALEKLSIEFGPEILLANGALNRKIMLNLLLNDRTAMPRQLEILKPFILPAVDMAVSEIIKMNPNKVIIVEAPLLFEYGQSRRYNPIIVVTTSYETQVRRLMERSGKPRIWAEKVISLQWPMAEKMRLTDYIINNEHSLEFTKKQVANVYKRICEKNQLGKMSEIKES